jgi:hypothetical protein
MAQSKRTICALSAPVTVFADELAQELLKKLPREACDELLRRTIIRSQERLLAQDVRNRKSDAYKATLVARTMAARLAPISADLQVLLGEGAPEESDGISTESGAPTPEEDFVAGIEIPTFAQFSHVFDQYPYVRVEESPSLGRLLILGYLSGRGRVTNKLFRRNCTVVFPDGRRKSFNDLVSVIGFLRSPPTIDGSQPSLKGIPYVPGIGVKFWTNIVGEGDDRGQYRYLLFTENSSQTFTTEPAWEIALHKYKADRSRAQTSEASSAQL